MEALYRAALGDPGPVENCKPRLPTRELMKFRLERICALERLGQGIGSSTSGLAGLESRLSLYSRALVD